MKPLIRNLVTFHSGMIGDFLMLLNLAENAYLYDNSINTKIFVTRNLALFKELMSDRYPFVYLIPLTEENTSSKHYRYDAIKNILKVAFSRNAFFLLKFYKGDSLKTIIFGWLLSRLPGSRFVSFGENYFCLKKLLCTDVLSFNPNKDYFQNLLSETDRLGWPRIFERPSFRYTPNENTLIKHRLGNKDYVVMHITPTRKNRTLPVSRWAKITEQILNIAPNADIILTGSSDDYSFIQELVSLCGNKQIRNYAGKFSITELISVIHYSNLYIGVDTGITHLASMMGKKSLVIGHLATPASLPTYAPNSTILFNKNACLCQNNNCAIYENGKQYMRCMLYITDEVVDEALEKLLGKKSQNKLF